jgi:hypothetical protein
VLLLLLSVAVDDVSAFYPNRLLTFIGEWSLDRESRTHQTITDDGFKGVVQEFLASNDAGITKTADDVFKSISFLRAATALKLAVPLPDVKFWTYQERIHCDDEKLNEAHLLAKEYNTRIVADIRNSNIKNARYMCGNILHTVQDFYSHSSWVDMNATVNLEFGNDDFISLSNLAGEDDPTCDSCTSLDETCCDNLISSYLTSGYFSFWPFTNAKPEGKQKCSHGNSDRTAQYPPIGGINKDSYGSIKGCNHSLAATLAAEATTRYILNLKERLSNDTLFAHFLGVTSPPPTLCFGFSLSSQANTVIGLLLGALGLFSSDPLWSSINFVIPIPGLGALQYTPSNILNDYAGIVNALGSFDLSTIAMFGLEQAISSSQQGSACILISDGPAVDSFLIPLVLSTALDKEIKINVLSIGSIFDRRRRRRRSADNEFETLTQLTGGSFVQVGLADFSTTLEAMLGLELAAESQVTVFASDNAVSSFTFSVDSTLSGVVITLSDASSSLSSFQLTAPSGASFTSYELSVDQSDLKVVKFSDSATLETGEWSLSFTNDGSVVSAKVKASSDVSFTYQFTNLVDVYMPGYLPISGNPVVGVSDYILLVDLRGASVGGAAAVQSNITVRLIGSDDSVIASLPAHELEPLEQYAVLLPTITTQAFRVVLEGQDSDDNQLMRYFDMLVQPSEFSMNVTVVDETSIMLGNGGTELHVSVAITNHGLDSGSVELHVKDTMGYYHGLETLTVSVSGGETKIVTLYLSSCNDTASSDDGDGGNSDDASDAGDDSGDGSGDGSGDDVSDTSEASDAGDDSGDGSGDDVSDTSEATGDGSGDGSGDDVSDTSEATGDGSGDGSGDDVSDTSEATGDGSGGGSGDDVSDTSEATGNGSGGGSGDDVSDTSEATGDGSDDGSGDGSGDDASGSRDASDGGTVDDDDDNDASDGVSPSTDLTIALSKAGSTVLLDHRVLTATLSACDKLFVSGDACSVLNIKGSCTDDCSSSSWTAHFHVRDRSVGLDDVSSVVTSVSASSSSSSAWSTLDVNDFRSGTTAVVNGFLTSSCCVQSAEIRAANTAGNLAAVCSVNAPAQKPISTSNSSAMKREKKSKCDKKQGWRKYRCKKKEKRDQRRKLRKQRLRRKMDKKRKSHKKRKN